MGGEEGGLGFADRFSEVGVVAEGRWAEGKGEGVEVKEGDGVLFAPLSGNGVVALHVGVEAMKRDAGRVVDFLEDRAGGNPAEALAVATHKVVHGVKVDGVFFGRSLKGIRWLHATPDVVGAAVEEYPVVCEGRFCETLLEIVEAERRVSAVLGIGGVEVNVKGGAFTLALQRRPWRNLLLQEGTVVDGDGVAQQEK